MPYSSNIFDKYVKYFLREDRPQRIVDIGAGAGKYGDMIKSVYSLEEFRNYFHKVYAVEPSSDYIDRFDLASKYDFVLNKDAMAFVDDHMDEWWDWAILGDVLEHMTKPVGLEVLHKLSYMAKNIIIVVPIDAFQNDKSGPYERHLSRWYWQSFLEYDVRAVLRRDNMLLVKLFFDFQR